MEELDENPTHPVLQSSSDPARATELQNYAKVLGTRPIRRCRELVAACRASGQRREDLKQAIIDGNKSGDWKINGELIQLPELQLLRDCETRWSSTFNMLGRILDLYLVYSYYSVFCLMLITSEHFRLLNSLFDDHAIWTWCLTSTAPSQSLLWGIFIKSLVSQMQLKSCFVRNELQRSPWPFQYTRVFSLLGKQ